MEIIIAIISFILGCITGVYLPIKFRKEDRIPKISIGTLQEKQLYFDITNHGGDIINLKIEIFWLQDKIVQSRVLTDFFHYSDDPLLAYPHNCHCLKKGETKKVSSCPLYSDNGEIKVIIEGADIGDKIYKEDFILKNKLRK